MNQLYVESNICYIDYLLNQLYMETTICWTKYLLNRLFLESTMPWSNYSLTFINYSFDQLFFFIETTISLLKQLFFNWNNYFFSWINYVFIETTFFLLIKLFRSTIIECLCIFIIPWRRRWSELTPTISCPETLPPTHHPPRRTFASSTHARHYRLIR